ncbi:MAG: efflux transporter outer membrane subunit [Rubrivivax sp.]|nr:MAG: efflux transporter outer membrane subunit [Rubrivivax sp.]
MKLLTALPCAFALAWLAGCATPVEPPQRSTEVALPARWRTDLGATAAQRADWWRGFGDPVLAHAVEAALAGNTDVATASARVREARAQEAVARSQRWPGLDFAVGASRSRSVGPLGQASESTAAQPVFQAAYELDLFGRVADQVRAAEAGTVAAEAARDTASLAVAAAAASGYLTLRTLDARLAVLRATLASRTESLRLASGRARVGYTSDLELRQAEAEYEATAQAVPQAEAAIARQEHALNLLAGAPPQDVPRGSALTALTSPPVPDALPSELLRRRPDIAQAEATLAASGATLANARAQFLPQVRLSASAGRTFSSSLADPITVWSLGASVLAPLFSAGRLQGQLDVAGARREQAALAYQRAVLTALREVEDALSSVARLREQRRHLEAQRAAVAEALRHAVNRYRGGYSSYLEQLDAQRSLLSAELALVQVVGDELTATVALQQALGGGWAR